MTIFVVAGSIALVASCLHALTLGLAMWWLRRAPRIAPARASAELVSVVRPVCGLEEHVDETLRSGFLLADPAYELIFCAHKPSDPVVPLVRRLVAEYPRISSQLLFGDAKASDNPKTDNIIKSGAAINGQWVMFCDSNVILHDDHIQRQIAAWTPATGAVSSPKIGVRPENFWAEVECSVLNSLLARWNIAVAAMGLGFAHGACMLMGRHDLERIGGVQALASEAAEDHALTKLVSARGLRVELANPVVQPLGRRSALEVWTRQARWARLCRLSFPLAFSPQVLFGALFPTIAAGIAASTLNASIIATVLGQIAFWYGAELIFVRAAGWHLSWQTLPACVVRDALIPIIWINAWISGKFRWRGKMVRFYRPQPRFHTPADNDPTRPGCP
jgi:ceramide glucosyltransferase